MNGAYFRNVGYANFRNVRAATVARTLASSYMKLEYFGPYR